MFQLLNAVFLCEVSWCKYCTKYWFKWDNLWSVSPRPRRQANRH